MLITLPTKTQHRRGPKDGNTVSPAPPPPPPPPPVALVLVAAEFDAAPSVRLTFDRAVNATGMDTRAVNVAADDGSSNLTLYQGVGSATMLSAETVEVSLQSVGTAAGSGTQLSASAGTAIVAVDDGGAWPGVTDQPLPLP